MYDRLLRLHRLLSLVGKNKNSYIVLNSFVGRKVRIENWLIIESIDRFFYEKIYPYVMRARHTKFQSSDKRLGMISHRVINRRASSIFMLRVGLDGTHLSIFKVNNEKDAVDKSVA
jgi:hypothetical protein